MPAAFTVETREGFRQVEFDPDVFRFKDVRILVDGQVAATMPFPKDASPFMQVDFELDGHALVGIAYLTPDPVPTDAIGVRYDLFANGRSLSSGRTIGAARSSAAAPGEAYPKRFQIVDMVARIVPAAAAPGFGIGIGRTMADAGFARSALLIAIVLGVFGAAAFASTRSWHRIRRTETSSVGQRMAVGLAIIIVLYLAAFVVLLLAVIVTAR